MELLLVHGGGGQLGRLHPPPEPRRQRSLRRAQLLKRLYRMGCALGCAIAQGNHRRQLLQLAEEFERCRNILLALGDENRQHLILTMMQIEGCGGVRVSELKERTHLSRPAVSHHIQVLKNAGIVKMRREGTKNYYYFDADAQSMNGLLRMIVHAKEIMERLPDRSEWTD